MKTKINHIENDWKRIKNHCRTTVNKEFTENEPSEKFKQELLISEHSPIRLLQIDWSWKDIKYWVGMEWARHKWEKFISTQRTDRTGEDRNSKPQDSLINFDGFANAQNLIDTERKRLCYQASKEARELGEDLKVELHKYEPELADVLVPNCIYRGGCPEFKTCGYWNNFTGKNKELDLLNIKTRYEAYNKEFFNAKEKMNND